MSLLEDLFLQDEASEAQELERIIEGDENDDRPQSAASNSDENSAKEDEAEEDKRRVDPANGKTKRVIKNPRFVLNPARLTGPRGIEIIPEHFKDFKFKGKGHEKEDLDLVLKKLEHWAYRLYPKFAFEDCLKKIEILGKKRPVMVHLQKIRSDQLQSVDTVVQKDSSDDEDKAPPEEDEFDKLLQQQIELARATPAPESARKAPPATSRHIMSPFTMPKATSSPSISDEQKERMLRNRKLAEERRLARLKQNMSNENPAVGTTRLNTLYERMSNGNEHSNSSDEEHHANVTISVQINTSSKDKDTVNDANDEDEIMYDGKVNEQENGEKKLVEETYIKRTSVNSSTHSENTLDYDNTIMNDNSLKGLQKNEIGIDVEHSTAEINGDISANVRNRHQETTEVLNKDVNDITNGKHKDQMNEECTSLTNEESCDNLEITKDDNSVKEVDNDCNENKFKNTSCASKSIETVTEEIVKVNGESAETAEIEQNEKVYTADTIQNADIDKLVESELMDVDFDDDF